MTHSAANMMGMAPREFRIGGVFGSAFNVYFRNIVSFTIVAAIVLLPVAVVLSFAIMNQDPRDPTGFFISVGVATVLGMILQPISTAVILYSAFQDMRGKTASFGEAIGWALNRFLPLLGLGIVYMLGVLAGMIALIVPGYILMVMWAVAIPACVVERTGPIDSLSRSSELTKGNRWQIFAIILIFGLISGVVGNIVQALGAAGGIGLLIIIMIIWQGISQSFNSVLMAVMYHDLRVSKEGGDVNRIASVFD
jgi:uncharacterized membrane protein